MKINSVLRSSGVFDKCLIYITNIKREITSNQKEPLSPASDVLTSLLGANIIGKDKEPKKKFPERPEMDKRVIQHKARVFNEDTYYYKTVENPTFSKIENVTGNTMKLADEFNRQKESFLKENTIKNYLEKKKMIQVYASGKILKSLDFNSQVKRSLV